MDCQHSKRSHYLTGTLVLVFLFRTMQAFAQPKCYEECTKFGPCIGRDTAGAERRLRMALEQEQLHQNSMDFCVKSIFYLFLDVYGGK